MTETRKILVVEDNEKNRKLFKLLISSMGHECLVAEDGNAGIEMAKQSNPDLILMDIQMPTLDGLSALALLRKTPLTSEVPVVAVTSYAMDHDRERLLAAGFKGYLSKPVDTDQFKTFIQELLDNLHD